MATYNLFVGIDIASASASISVLKHLNEKPRILDIPQTQSGYKRLKKFLRRYETSPQETLIVMEATGSYWIPLANQLDDWQYAVKVVNPASAYYFARSALKREKNDPMDALTLAEMGITLLDTLTEQLYHKPPPIYEELRQRLVQRDEFVHMKVQTSNRNHATSARGTTITPVNERSDALMVYLKREIKLIEKEIEQIYKDDDSEYSETAQYLLSVSGIGYVTCGWIQVATHNLLPFDTAEQLCSFAGLVPRTRQSGVSLNTRGKIGYSGHARLRHAMYTAAMSATMHNPHVKVFYKRLKDKKGKPPKVAIIASAHKLLKICYACATNKVMYDKNY